MSISNIIGNVFSEEKDQTVKDLYKLYSVYKLNKTTTNVDFLTFNYLLPLTKFKFNNSSLFISIFFFIKTPTLLYFENLKKQNQINHFGFFKRLSVIAVSPKTTLTKYSKLVLINLYNSNLSLYNNLLPNNYVNFNKKLLTTPKLGSSTTFKNINIFDFGSVEFQYLRKNKVYNKGRYSRCRQNYRTGVYICMYLSIISIFGLYYWFLKFSFNFTYLWWFFISFVGSFMFSKIVKYRLYNPITIINKTFDFFRWCSILIKSFLN